MSESLILLIAVGLLAALVILLIVIARLLVGVRHALAASRAAEATPAAEEESTPLQAGPVDALLIQEPEAAEIVPSERSEPVEPVPSEPSEPVEPVPIGSSEPVEPVPMEEPAPIAAAHETPEVVTAVGPEEPEMAVEPEPVEASVASAASEAATTADDDPFADTSFADAASDQVPEPAEPQPYQRDGRWWFERDGELLVYDDVKAEWVPAGAEGSESLEQAVEIPEQVVEDVPPETTEPVAADTSMFTESPSDAAVAQEPGSDVAPEDVPVQSATSPWAATQTEDPFLHPLDEPRPEDATASASETETAIPEAEQEPVTTTPDVEQETVSGQETAMPAAADTGTAEPAPAEQAPQPASYWKCPSCGVVNGSTATSCRMCFTARP